MPLDLRTLLIAIVCTMLIFTLLFGVVAYRHPKLHGTHWWTGSCLIQAIGVMFLGSRGYIPDGLSIIGGNSLTVAGTVAAWIGLRAFFGLHGRWGWLLLIMLPFTALFFVFTEWWPSQGIRQALSAATAGVVLIATSRDVLQHASPNLRLESRALAGFLWLGALLHLLRILALLWLPTPAEGLAPTAADAWILLAFFVSGSGRLFMLIPLIAGHLQELRSAAERAEKHTSVRLRDSELHLAAILDNAPDAMITTDAVGKIESINLAAERFFGYSPPEIIGQSIARLLPEHLDQYLATTRAIGPQELTARRRDGSQVMVELGVSLVSLGQRNITVGIFHDVSERHRVATMKNEFISVVSHELRTPLTSIRGALGLLNSGAFGSLPAPAAELTRVANDNAIRLTLLLNDILDMEQLEYGTAVIATTRQALRPLVEQAVAANQGYAAQHGVHLVLQADTHGDLQITVADHRFIQILSNLISNAVKFSPLGETVHVQIEHRAANARIAVIDHGPGVPLDFHDRIFQKFAQADASNVRNNVGTGLGLSIARGLTERMGGTIGFDSVPGQGATFYVEFACEAKR